MQLLTMHDQEVTQMPPEPFPLLEVGSGNKTMLGMANKVEILNEEHSHN